MSVLKFPGLVVAFYSAPVVWGCWWFLGPLSKTESLKGFIPALRNMHFFPLQQYALVLSRPLKEKSPYTPEPESDASDKDP